MARPVPTRSFVKKVPDASSKYDNMKGLYDGVFGGNRLGC
jgi:hypothetical protein